MTDYISINKKQVQSESDSFTKFRYRQFQKHFKQGTRLVLDVGCNTGRGGSELSRVQNNLVVHGVDCIKERLEKLPLVYAKKTCSLTTALDMPDDYYDVVVAGEFIEHLTNEDVTLSLQEFSRVLKKGGMLMLTTPNPSYIRLKLTGKSVLGGSHLSQHLPKSLKEQLENHNYQKIKIYGSGKMTHLVGAHFPFLWLYGSYLVICEK